MRLVIISGRAGSGKTLVLHALEDLGFYCIDNLPLSFFPKLGSEIGNLQPLIAISIDVRNIPLDPNHFRTLVEDLNSSGKTCEIVYLDADENTLLKRFSETRRKHPLSNKTTSLREAIEKERTLLTPVANLADFTIDTTSLTPQALQNFIRDKIANTGDGKIQLLLESFGFKHGLPSDADFVFDIRCLPNPYWKSELRMLSGLQTEVIHYLQSIPEVQQMLSDICIFLEKWIPCFEADNRSYITIAIGCTGGQHRSVYMVEEIAKRIHFKVKNTQIRHRELQKVV